MLLLFCVCIIWFGFLFTLFNALYHGYIFWKILYENRSFHVIAQEKNLLKMIFNRFHLSDKDKKLLKILLHPFHLWKIFTQSTSGWTFYPKEIYLRANILMKLSRELPEPPSVDMVRAVLAGELRTLLLTQDALNLLVEKGLLGQTSIRLIRQYLLEDDKNLNRFRKNFPTPPCAQTTQLLKVIQNLNGMHNEEILRKAVEEGAIDNLCSSEKIPLKTNAKDDKILPLTGSSDHHSLNDEDPNTPKRFIAIGKHHHDEHSFVFTGIVHPNSQPEVHYKFGKQRHSVLWGNLKYEGASIKRDISYVAYEIQTSEYKRFINMIVWMNPSLKIHFEKDPFFIPSSFKEKKFNKMQSAMIKRSHYLTPWNNCRTTAIDILSYALNTNKLKGGISSQFYNPFPSYARFREGSHKTGTTGDPFYIYPQLPSALGFNHTTQELKNELEVNFTKMEEILKTTNHQKQKRFNEAKYVYQQIQQKTLLLSSQSIPGTPLADSKLTSGSISLT